MPALKVLMPTEATIVDFENVSGYNSLTHCVKKKTMTLKRYLYIWKLWEKCKFLIFGHNENCHHTKLAFWGIFGLEHFERPQLTKRTNQSHSSLF